jgi:enoyl-CoA hydratase/carnithine racemase/predicted RNase H-like HicB family nuclease
MPFKRSPASLNLRSAMLTEFFLESSLIERVGDESRYVGHVPDLPEIRVDGATQEECRAKLADAISELLSAEITRQSRSAIDETEAEGQKNDQPVPALSTKTDQSQAEPAAINFTDILYEKRDWVARVTINRPEVYNAYASATLQEMAAAFRDASADPSVAVLVLTGAGERAFCSGGDLKEHAEEHLNHPDQFSRWLDLLVEAHRALREVGKPTVARINGLVAGGGNGWNLACDLAVAADHAKFMHVETSIGLIAAPGSAAWLPLVVGERRAKEMLLLGDPVSANKALLWGLVNDVVPYAELDSSVEALCKKLINRFPASTAHTRESASLWKNLAWDSTLEDLRELLSSHFSGPEAAEGMAALLEKREIDYQEYRRQALARLYNTDESERGEGLDGQAQTCPSCGEGRLPESFKFCGHCGARL